MLYKPSSLNLQLESSACVPIFLVIFTKLSQSEKGLRALSMSDKEDAEVKRLYRCARTYNKIVRQFDELMEIMNTKTKPPKRRGKNTNAVAHPEHNEVIVQTVSRFLQELRNDYPDAKTSSTTRSSN